MTWSYECPEDPRCNQCEEYDNGEVEVQCTFSNGAGFEVLIQPNRLVTFTCVGNPNWADFYLGTKNPIKYIDRIFFNDCNPPKMPLAAVTKKLLAGEISRLRIDSRNNETTLPNRKNFRGLNNLQELELRFPNLSNLTEDVFEDLKNLKHVDLSANNLEKLPENLFRNSKLHTIQLGSNRLETFEVHTFDVLANLQELYIWQNNLRNLLPHTFDGLPSLVTLDMNCNFLETLPNGIFKTMRKLRFIYLSENNFTGEALPGDLFKYNVELKWVTMSDNKRNMTTFPNGFFANLIKLEDVELKKNGLIYLTEDLFRGTRNLKYVNIEGNFLNTLPSKIFSDTTEMATLNLKSNDLSYLSDDIFEKLGKLVDLDLSHNHLTSVNE